MRDDARPQDGPDEDHDETAEDEATPKTKLPLPFAPDEDDDSALGDTDQHSDA